ncbi:MAG TPA: universal stress protein [Polyangia bacterium]
MAAIRKILVATDFSPIAVHAQKIALELARPLGAEVTVLHVYALPTYLFVDGSTYVPPAKVVADILSDAARGLAAAVDAAASSGVTVTTVSAEGDPAEAIVRYADEHRFDLVVLGTHGRRGLARLALGSVAEHVVRAAKVPVMTVHAER